MAGSIAVHLVTYNSAHHILACLQGLQAQTVPFDLVVIDNASSDETVTLLRDAGVTVQVNSTNIGYAAAHNQALAYSDSDYVLTLNPDVALQPGFLAAVVAALDRHPTVGAANGCLLRVEKLGEVPHSIDSMGLWMQRNRRQRLIGEGWPVTQVRTDERFIFGPDGAAAVYRRAMLTDIALDGQPFDADFFLHKEDIDLAWRAQWRGWQALYVPDAVAHHVRTFRAGHRENIPQHIRCLSVRNRYLLALKNDFGLLFWRDAVRILIYDVLIVGYVILRERASLAAFVSLVRLWRPTWRKRRRLRAMRRVSGREMQGWFRSQPPT